MKLSQLCSHVGAWLQDPGPMGDVILSSRVRLARNVAGYRFYAHANDTQRDEVASFVRSRLGRAELAERISQVEMASLAPMERQLLLERHLVSRQMSDGAASRWVAFTDDETLSLMINEEDHLRLQVLGAGQCLDPLYQRIRSMDEQLERHLHYAVSSQYGYLTACPTNVGTGIRVSVMLHLPGLKMSGHLERAFRAIRELGFAVRGIYGEGSEPIGDLYQLSNQVTLGKSEEGIITELNNLAIEPIVQYERLARDAMVTKQPVRLDDKLFRALGILTHARSISSEECLYHLGLLRLGIHLGRIRSIPLQTINTLHLLTQPAHLQLLKKTSLEIEERDTIRAEFVRNALREHTTGK